MADQLELQLPFEDFTGKIGSQIFAKDNYKRGGDIMVFKIPFKDIIIWEGYNARTIFENITDLADSLYSHKQKVPFQLVLVKDGNRAYLKKGGRRYKAYELLIQQGRFSPETEVPFELTNTKETVEEMILDLHVSNNLQESLKPIDLATVAWRLKHVCGKEKSNEEVSEEMKLSRQTVDNLIIIAEAPDDVKNQIREGSMTMTNAVAFVRSQRKQFKAADKAEEESHKTQTSINLEPQDSLKEEMKELEAIEQQALDYKERQDAIAAREQELLQEKANEVLVNKEALQQQQGKRLAANAILYYTEQVLNADTGELEPTDAFKIWSKQGTEIDDLFIEEILKTTIQSVWIFKSITIAESVITEPVAEREKDKWDLDRPEMAQIINCIKLADKIEAVINKIDCVPDGTKTDISKFVEWMQKDLAEVRQWVHSNKKQNKSR